MAAARGRALGLAKKGLSVRVSWILIAMWLAAISRCEEPKETATPPEPSPMATQPGPRPGDWVRVRGTLGEEVDCRILRTEAGGIYSLSARLGRYANGARVCIHGTVAEVSSCMTSPMIEVQALKPMTSCP